MEDMISKKIKIHNMKIRNILIAGIFLLASIASYSQDRRTEETRIADLLARLPAQDVQSVNKLMSEMFSLGEAAMKRICDQIIPIGTGDDTRPRFAVESMSRYLSQFGKDA